MPQFQYSSIFGELTRMVQLRFDAASQLNKRLFDNVIMDRYLDWDTPTIGLDFEEAIGKYNITIAAPTIGENAKESILGSNGLETLKERVLNHAITKSMTISEYRKVQQLLDSKSLPDKAKTEQLVKLMWGDVQDVVGSVLAKLDFIFLTALFNEGKCTLDASNNPEGGVRGTIDYNQDPDNIVDVKADSLWTKEHATSVDCFQDIQSVIDLAQDKTEFAKILCSPSIISYICRSTNVRKMIWGTDKSSRMVLLKDLNAYMQENNYPVFEPLRRQIRIQDGRTVTPLNPINESNLVFVPDGKLGIIKNAWANNEIRPEPGVSYSNYGRIRVSKWGVGETQGSNGVEFTKAEALALPVITEMNGIYTLKTGFSSSSTSD